MQQQKNILKISEMLKVLDVLIADDKQYLAMLPQLDKIFNNLMQSEQLNEYLPYQLQNKRKKRQRKGL